MQVSRPTLSPPLVLTLCVGALAACAMLFMVVGAKGSWSFILAFRGMKLVALLIVAFAIAISTVLFQTVTNNRILTPAIMGFDSLFILVQTILIFLIGSAGVSQTDSHLLFFLQAAAMMLFSGLLFRWLFSGAVRSLHLLLLVGILFGGFFRSLAAFLQRVIDPNEFVVLQDMLFASFNSVDPGLIATSLAVIAVTSVVVAFNLDRFDVLLLGRENAINLGVDHRRMVTLAMAIIAILVSVSTALVGPVTFFGLLVANLAYLLVPTYRHAYVIPVAALLAAIILIGGQMVLERLFSFSTALSIIIEFVGGLAFILLLIRGRRK
ncbi:MAG: iron chelate uptake ABC transporter family permease subunit [Rhizobiales bacterium]|nr:iron chelate uptake ABC transporter family permease subunit [Hyphomicrobiales bacterium]